MAALNPDSVTGEFHAKAPIEKPIAAQNPGPRDQPLDAHTHQPGNLHGNDRIPSFHAQTLPPGTAPEDHTFAPNTVLLDNAVNEESTSTSATDTLGGATSKDVYTGLGKPVQGESSKELRHDGQTHRKKERAGLAGIAGSEAAGEVGTGEL